MNFLKAFIFPLLINPFGELIKDLDSPSYEVRRASLVKLEKMEHLAAEHIEFQAKYNKNIQIRRSCEILLERLYRGTNTYDVYLNIWILPRHRRFIDGEDISEKYYLKTREYLMDFDNDYMNTELYNEELTQQLAVTFYLRDEIKKRGRLHALGVLKEIEEMDSKRIAMASYRYEDGMLPPEPIEDIIENKQKENNDGTISKKEKRKTRKSKH